MKDKVSKLVNVYKKYGFRGFIKKLYAYIRANYLDKISFRVFLRPRKYQKIIKDILTNNKYDRIILWRSSFGYNVPLFQRPQHIASNLANNKCLVLYEVTTMTDKVKTLKMQKNNLYLFNYNNVLLNRILLRELSKTKKPKYIELYSTDWKLTKNKIEDYMNKGYGFIYEYIDHLSPVLAGTKELPKNIVEKYEFAMENPDVYVIVSASELEKDVINKRGEVNLAFSSNGVDYNFFQNTHQKTLEKEFMDIVNNGKINIGYYGALAKWFDYDLIKKIAKTNKYNIILFGIKYDESYDEKIMQFIWIY